MPSNNSGDSDAETAGDVVIEPGEADDADELGQEYCSS
jgi:hypothetical protein